MTNDIIEMMGTSLLTISVGTLNHLLLSLGKAGRIETMMKVIEVFSVLFPIEIHHNICLVC